MLFYQLLRTRRRVLSSRRRTWRPQALQARFQAPAGCAAVCPCSMVKLHHPPAGALVTEPFRVILSKCRPCCPCAACRHRFL